MSEHTISEKTHSKRNSRSKKKRPRKVRRSAQTSRAEDICWDWHHTGTCAREGCRWLHDDFRNNHPQKFQEKLQLVRSEFRGTWSESKLSLFETALSSDFSLAQINLKLAQDFRRADDLKLHALASELSRVVIYLKSKDQSKIWFNYEAHLYKCLKRIFEDEQAFQSSDITTPLHALFLWIDDDIFTGERRKHIRGWKKELEAHKSSKQQFSPAHAPLQGPAIIDFSVARRHSEDSQLENCHKFPSRLSLDDLDNEALRAAQEPPSKDDARKVSPRRPSREERKNSYPNVNDGDDSDSDASIHFKEPDDVVVELELLQKELSEHCDYSKMQHMLQQDHIEPWVRNFQRIIDRVLHLPTHQISNLPNEDLQTQVDKLEQVTIELCEILEQVHREPQLQVAMDYSKKLLAFLRSMDIRAVSNTIESFKRSQESKNDEEQDEDEGPLGVPELDVNEDMANEVEMDVGPPSENGKASDSEKDIEPAILKLMKNTAYKLLRAFPGQGVLADLVRQAICRACGIQKTYQQVENALRGYIQSQTVSGRRMVSLHKSIISKMYLDWEQTHLLGFQDHEIVLLCEFPTQPNVAREELAALRSIYVRVLGVERVISGAITENTIPIAIVTKTHEIAAKIQAGLSHYHSSLGGEQTKTRIVKDIKELRQCLCKKGAGTSKLRVHPSSKFVEALSNDIEAHYRALLPSKENRNRRSQLREHLRPILERVSKKMGKRAYFEVFGSTANGLNTINSDVDLSVHLQDLHGKEIAIIDSSTARKILMKMAREMKRDGYKDVTPVLFARVPIVKFRDKEFDIESDISIRNSLSKFKTRLLKMFLKTDRRVKPLILAVKHWAKSRDIGDAARGTLNMFGYTLLVIQFLQCVQPPVLPVVSCTAHWDADENWKKNASSFEGYGKDNQMQLGELLISFFEFYRRFNFEDGAISVRAGKPILKGRCHCQPGHKRIMIVEDPFDTSDNCARNITESVLRTIRQEFVRAYAILAGGRFSMLELCVPKSKNNVTQPNVMSRSPHRTPQKKQSAQRSPHLHAYSPSTVGVFSHPPTHLLTPGPYHDTLTKPPPPNSMFVNVSGPAPSIARHTRISPNLEPMLAPIPRIAPPPPGPNRVTRQSDYERRVPPRNLAPGGPSNLAPRTRPNANRTPSPNQKPATLSSSRMSDTIFNVLASTTVPSFPPFSSENEEVNPLPPRELEDNSPQPLCAFSFPFLKRSTSQPQRQVSKRPAALVSYFNKPCKNEARRIRPL